MKTLPPKSGNSLFLMAAWYGCITPFISAGALYIIGNSETLSHQLIRDLLAILICILVSSLVSAVVSLFGVPSLGAKRILPKAIIGILFGLGVGYFALMGWAFTHMSE